ncbi:MAG: hypothetical protein D6767_05945 [Candidatus Hydrogenedentota bacterium]|nr:MAG: hypothetical protein D6767_05945 [Candidatus Hydrogenedentota bacterium]
MPSKFEFDDTREAIGADKMTDEERREMLRKFREAGGEVLSERELRELDKAAMQERARAKKSGRGAIAREMKLPSEIYRERRRLEAERKAKEKAEREKALKKLRSPMAKFFIRLRCVMAGVAPFSTRSVKPKFLAFIALEVRQAIVEFNLLGNELFLQDVNLGKVIANKLDKKNPLYMEVLERVHSLHKEPAIQEFLSVAEQYQNQFVAISAISESLKKFYARLYYIYPYQEALRQAFRQAIEIAKKESDDSTLLQHLAEKEKRIPKNIKNVFQVAFPKLFQLICLADETDYPPFSPLLEKVIGIENDERLGRRKRGEDTSIASNIQEVETKEEVNDEETTEETEEKQQEEKKSSPVMQTKEYEYGFRLMKRLSPPEMQKKYDTNRLTENLNYNDKVFLAWLFFMEFDQEYSFVLTTNKIKLNVDYSSGLKIDYHQILTDLYNESRDIIRAFEKYIEARKELEKIKSTKMSSNYIEQSKMETKAESRVDVEARNTRALIRKFMENVTKNLAKLIADMKGEKKIVANMDEPITFDKNLEGSKRLNGKAIKDCIMEAYCYSVALKEQLENGYLYGGVIELTDEEMKEFLGQTYSTPTES